MHKTLPVEILISASVTKIHINNLQIKVNELMPLWALDSNISRKLRLGYNGL